MTPHPSVGRPEQAKSHSGKSFDSRKNSSSLCLHSSSECETAWIQHPRPGRKDTCTHTTRHLCISLQHHHFTDSSLCPLRLSSRGTGVLSQQGSLHTSSTIGWVGLTRSNNDAPKQRDAKALADRAAVKIQAHWRGCVGRWKAYLVQQINLHQRCREAAAVRHTHAISYTLIHHSKPPTSAGMHTSPFSQRSSYTTSVTSEVRFS